LETGALKTSSIQVDNHAQFNNYLDVKGGLSVGSSVNIDGSLNTNGTIQFSNYGTGTVQSDADGNLSVSSDERLKNIVGSFATGLDAILALKPINYRWNKQSGLEQERLYTGFSAQNVQSVLPEAVGEDSRGYLTLSDRPIIGALVNAIKKLDHENTALKTTLKVLTEKIEQLEKNNR